jgi:hypothetical protein
LSVYISTIPLPALFLGQTFALIWMLLLLKVKHISLITVETTLLEVRLIVYTTDILFSAAIITSLVIFPSSHRFPLFSHILGFVGQQKQSLTTTKNGRQCEIIDFLVIHISSIAILKETGYITQQKLNGTQSEVSFLSSFHTE